MSDLKIGDTVKILSAVPRHLQNVVGTIEDVSVIQFRSGTQTSYKVRGLFFSAGELLFISRPRP